ncbi:MAG: D-galactarolactone cycloisomerase [Alphaproteobacteria bacterium MarineAlpha4_Bin2]|nr:MAG: D-galactarolactone cycloisomerase [Alphaproteobacteria bacterium MarineAlpha4_Bin2]
MSEFPKTPSLDLLKVEPILLRARIETPVVTSFGKMEERAVLLVRAEEKDGTVGWGEVFGNFPAHGAENREHLIHDYIAPLALSETWLSPADAFKAITKRTHIMSLQAGEPGPFAQAIAGVDIALWDIAARKLGQPLWKLLGGTRNCIPTYASGLNPSDFEEIVMHKLNEGYAAFKIKIGFGRETDFAALSKMRNLIGNLPLMADVNQGWDVDTACANWEDYSAFDLLWIEEPLPADRPLDEWQRIASLGGSPIAAGENLLSEKQFDEHIGAQAFNVVQPDICKWGGFTKTLPLARRIVGAGLTYCPHFLAGPIGVMASAHCLAAAGGDGVLEIDANPNPIREELTGGLPRIEDGIMAIAEGPGLGIEPDASKLDKFTAS